MENGIMSQIKTSGSLKLFWISVDPSRHGIMLIRTRCDATEFYASGR